MQSLMSLTTTAVFALFALAVRAEVPDRIPDPAGDEEPPIWMSADEAVDAAGAVRSDRFDPLPRKYLEDRLRRARQMRLSAEEETSEESCPFFIYSPPHPVALELSFETLLDHADLAFVGTIEDRAQGFYHGHLNSLLEIRIERILEAPSDLQGIDRLYTTFPHVEVKVGSEVLCVRSDRYPERPVPGKRIMIFTNNIPDREPLIVAPNIDTFLFETAEGEVSLPERFGDAVASLTWEVLVDRAVEAARADGR